MKETTEQQSRKLQWKPKFHVLVIIHLQTMWLMLRMLARVARGKTTLDQELEAVKRIRREVAEAAHEARTRHLRP